MIIERPRRRGYQLHAPDSPEAGALLAEQGLGLADLERAFAASSAPRAPRSARSSGSMRTACSAPAGRAGDRTCPRPAPSRSLHSPDSRAFYARKRREGKRHHQALIALARRRINVLWAMLQRRQPYVAAPPSAAA